MAEIFIGVDSHLSTLAAAAVDGVGKVLQVDEFENDPRGHRRFVAWRERLTDEVRIGIESSGNYGNALARVLVAAGEQVFEVPANLSHREARRQGRGKSDPIDAVAIARVVAREDVLPRPRVNQTHESLKLLSDRFDHLRRLRTQLANRIHKALLVSRPGYDKRIGSLKAERHKAAVMALLRRDRSVRADLVRRNIKELRRIDREIRAVKFQMTEILESTNTSLTEQAGIGPVIAARLLGDVGDVANARSKAAFARLSGTAPMPASSGQTVRHRLNRHGNRKLNYAIHYIAVTRCRLEPETKAFMARKLAEGKTRKEAMRCLKRHLSNAIYRTMVSDVTVRGASDELRALPSGQLTRRT